MQSRCCSRLATGSETTINISLLDSVPLLIGVVLALSIGGFATLFRLDRDRAFYPTVMMVIAAYYLLFAIMGGSREALLHESVVAAAFVIASIIGYKKSLWLVVGALAAHGVFDIIHSRFIANPGVPAWWPPFCSAYDIVAAAYLASLLRRNPRLAEAM